MYISHSVCTGMEPITCLQLKKNQEQKVSSTVNVYLRRSINGGVWGLIPDSRTRFHSWESDIEILEWDLSH